MFELRWKVEEWEEYKEDGVVNHTEKPVLQYRQRGNPSELGVQPPSRAEWRDVQTEHIQT